MRRRWGRNPQSPESRSTSRYQKLGVERLEDRHLLSAGALSFAGDAALSLLPVSNPTVASDARLFTGPLPLEASLSARDAVNGIPTSVNVNSVSKSGVEFDGPGSQLEIDAAGPGGGALNSNVFVDIDSPNFSQIAATVTINGGQSLSAITALAVHTGQNVYLDVDLDEFVVLRSANQFDPRMVESLIEATKPRPDRGESADLSDLAFVASKIEPRDPVRPIEDDGRFLLTAPANAAANVQSFVSSHLSPSEIELVSVSVKDPYAARFVELAELDLDLDTEVPIAANVEFVEHGGIALNEHEIVRADEPAPTEVAVVAPESRPASLLDHLPVDFRAVDQALNELLGEIESLGGDLSGWLDVTAMSPLNVAAGVVAISGIGGWYVRRIRLRRTRQQRIEAESSSWLFTQSHGFATGSTL